MARRSSGRSRTLATILWRRLDAPGHEYCELSSRRTGSDLWGTSLFMHGRAICRLEYIVRCDRTRRTVSALVWGLVGRKAVSVSVSVDWTARWRLNDTSCPAVAGCTDIDLHFSPSTNSLPIRRLQLAVGEEARVRAAWLRFPDLRLMPLEQRYRRTGPTTYRYESGRFHATLEVNAAGVVTRYGTLWRAETK